MKNLFVMKLMASVAIVGFVFPVRVMGSQQILDVYITYKPQIVIRKNTVDASELEKHKLFGMEKPELLDEYHLVSRAQYTDFLDNIGCVWTRKNFKQIIPQMIQKDIFKKSSFFAESKRVRVEQYLFPKIISSSFIKKINEGNTNGTPIVHKLYEDREKNCLMLRYFIQEKKTRPCNDLSLMVEDKKNSEAKSHNSAMDEEEYFSLGMVLLLGMMGNM